jgi:hypothetical protein
VVLSFEVTLAKTVSLLVVRIVKTDVVTSFKREIVSIFVLIFEVTIAETVVDTSYVAEIVSFGVLPFVVKIDA